MKLLLLTGALSLCLPAIALEVFEARMYPMNKKVTNLGFVKVSVVSDQKEVYATVDFFGSEQFTSRVVHQQGLYKADRCPRMELDDMNQDGIIDINEAKSVTGQMIAPFDADISSSQAGQYIYPVSHYHGEYTWTRKVSFKDFMKALNIVDSAGFRTNHIFMVHGVNENVSLPISVVTDGRLTADQTIPIACGKILLKNHSYPSDEMDWASTWY